jgi:hypothetical protein
MVARRLHPFTPGRARKVSTIDSNVGDDPRRARINTKFFTLARIRPVNIWTPFPATAKPAKHLDFFSFTRYRTPAETKTKWTTYTVGSDSNSDRMHNRETTRVR